MLQVENKMLCYVMIRDRLCRSWLSELHPKRKRACKICPFRVPKLSSGDDFCKVRFNTDLNCDKDAAFLVLCGKVFHSRIVRGKKEELQKGLIHIPDE